MKKRIFFYFLLIVVLSGAFYLDRLMPVITGYAAKNLASGVFVSGRSQEALEAEDLHFSLIRYTTNTVDTINKEVTSRFLWGQSKAICLNGYGCTLVKDFSVDEIRERSYPHTIVLPERADTIPWPMGDVVADSIPQGMNMAKLNQAVAQAMSDTIPFKGTFALMVLYKGQPVAEVYRHDFNPQTRFLSWSMAKSFINTLIGLRAKEGKISLDSPIELAGKKLHPESTVTVRNLLQMNSGLEWNEDYGNLSDVTIMLHKVGDMGAYTAQKPVQFAPDSVWSYSSGSSNLASLALRHSFATDTDYLRYPREALFNKIGMRSAVFELDASGTFAASSYLYATMHDYARFALLYMNQGNWHGEQLISQDWVTYTRQPAAGSKGRYGLSFWLNQSGNFPDAPADMFMCKGHDGQFIFMIPSKELVVVRTGYSPKGTFDANLLLKGILASLEE